MPKLSFGSVDKAAQAKSRANDKERKRIKKEADAERRKLLRKR